MFRREQLWISRFGKTRSLESAMSCADFPVLGKIARGIDIEG